MRNTFFTQRKNPEHTTKKSISKRLHLPKILKTKTEEETPEARAVRHIHAHMDKKKAVEDFVRGNPHNILITGAGLTGVITAAIMSERFPTAKIVILDKRTEDKLSINIGGSLQPIKVLRTFAPKLAERFKQAHPEIATDNGCINRIVFNKTLADFLDEEKVLVLRGEDIPKLVHTDKQISLLDGLEANFSLVCGTGGAANRRGETEILSEDQPYLYCRLPSNMVVSYSQGGRDENMQADRVYDVVVAGKPANLDMASFSVFLNKEFAKEHPNQEEIFEELKPQIEAVAKKQFPNETFDFDKAEGAIKGTPVEVAQLVSRACFNPVLNKNYVSLGDEACGSSPNGGNGLMDFSHSLDALLRHIDNVGLNTYVMADPQRADSVNKAILEGHMERLALNVRGDVSGDLKAAYRSVFAKLYTEKVNGLWSEEQGSFMEEIQKRIVDYCIKHAFYKKDTTLLEALYPKHSATALKHATQQVTTVEEAITGVSKIVGEIPATFFPEGYKQLPDGLFSHALDIWNTLSKRDMKMKPTGRFNYSAILQADIGNHLTRYMEEYGGREVVEKMLDNLPKIDPVFSAKPHIPMGRKRRKHKTHL